MKKGIIAILSILALSALVPATAALAVAEEATVTDKLLVPSAYEQYLPLNEPSDIAVCEDYTAIADGNTVYLFDRADNVYRRYEHTLNTDVSKNKVTKLQFDGNDDLYFLDASTYLYKIDETEFNDLATATVTETGVPCSAFLIEGDWLYYTNVTTEAQLSKVPLSDLNIHSAQTLVREIYSKPALAFWEGELYYTDAGKYLNKIDPTLSSPTPTPVAAFSAEIVSMTVAGGVFACSDIDGTFSVYSLHDFDGQNIASKLPPAYKETDKFASLTAFGANVYVVNSNAVKEYDVETATFTTYEICASSTSKNRLHGATELFLANEKLYVADAGNKRISVYDTATEAFLSPIPTKLSVEFLAAYEDTVLVADRETAVLYNGNGESIGTFDGFNGKLIGVASVYGKFYLATDNNYFYCLEQGEAWARAETKKTSTRYPKLLTADARGDLYILSGNDVFRFTEETFVSAKETGEEVCKNLPDATQKIAVDYAGNVYALTSDSVYKFTPDGRENIAFTTPLVYYPQGAPNVSAFAFGIEENEAYLLCDGNYLLQTERLLLPTVKNIAVNGIDEKVFGQAEAEFKVVTAATHTLLVEFDIEALQSAEVFPYVAYMRSNAPLTALKIGETEKYNLLAVFDTQANRYYTYLAPTAACEELPTETYRTDYAEAEQKTGYLTNAVALYKFPYLTPLLTVNQLPRGGKVTVLGEVTELDNNYYHVSYTDENGATKTGYIPQTYVTDFDGSPKESETTYHGETASNRDALWRLAYLILGFLAICILTDYLILRKVDKD